MWYVDYFFWGYAMALVRRAKPASIDELMSTLEDVAMRVPENMDRDSVANLRKQCKACIENFGGHFPEKL